MRCAPARPASVQLRTLSACDNAQLGCRLTVFRGSFALRSSCPCMLGLLQPLLHRVSKLQCGAG